MLRRALVVLTLAACASGGFACGDLRREAADGGASTVDAPSGPPPLATVSGGACASGATGQTAFRVRFDPEPSDAGGATPVTEVLGLSDDPTFFSVSTFIGPGGHAPTFAGETLGTGGIALDKTNGIDVTFSLRNLPPIRCVTLALLTRSNTPGTSASFQWSGGHGSGKSPPGSVGATATNAWVKTDVTSELGGVDFHDNLRMNAGPPSDALIVQRIELCVELTR